MCACYITEQMQQAPWSSGDDAESETRLQEW